MALTGLPRQRVCGPRGLIGGFLGAKSVDPLVVAESAVSAVLELAGRDGRILLAG